jgi:hypothetical protein
MPPPRARPGEVAGDHEAPGEPALADPAGAGGSETPAVAGSDALAPDDPVLPPPARLLQPAVRCAGADPEVTDGRRFGAGAVAGGSDGVDTAGVWIVGTGTGSGGGAGLGTVTGGTVGVGSVGVGTETVGIGTETAGTETLGTEIVVGTVSARLA